MDDLMLRVENISKEYKLGQIGGTTLRDELQRLGAKIRKKEDPTKIIGSADYTYGESFLALDDVSFDVMKGERVGIIGHNGAGKSTLLKLISRITAPTKGEIGINGRVASMLEVGTGFHGELTGRENIYMNGAILGMRKKEIDAKIEDIIDFSECRMFIDTPVKRYSSGMYVKLAFSVAAHLDSEIMIMDEVLAVGDMSFQKKCLDKMSEVSAREGRTILYVSHNMSTIRQLCERCIVLDHGKIVYDGDTENAINIYLHEVSEKKLHNDFTVREKDPWITEAIKIDYVDVIGKDNIVSFGDKFSFALTYEARQNIGKLVFRITVLELDRTAVATAVSDELECREGKSYKKVFELDTSAIAPGDYMIQIVAFEPSGWGKQERHDYLPCAVAFTISPGNQLYNFKWSKKAWGTHVLPNLVNLDE